MCGGQPVTLSHEGLQPVSSADAGGQWCRQPHFIQMLEACPGEQKSALHVQGQALEVLPGLACEGGQGQQAPDGILGELLIVLLTLHDDMPADLESGRVHLGGQHVLGNPVLQGRVGGR